MNLNAKQKQLAMMQESDSYRKSATAFYLEMRELEDRSSEADQRDAVLESAAHICLAMAQDWLDKVAEGSETGGYEDQVLKDAAIAIRRLKRQSDIEEK